MRSPRGWFDYALAEDGAAEQGGPLTRGRRAGALVFALLAIKLLVSAWNVIVFDGSSYDETGLHAPRSRTGGLGLDGRVYNGPLYYLPAYPLAARQAKALGGWPEAEVTFEASSKARENPERKALDDALLERLRWTNLGHVAVFYIVWIGLIIPRVLKDRWSRLVAALCLLALPGYQKLACMVHPDAAMTSLTALTLSVFVALRVRDHERPPATWELLGLALLGGLAALARPFGVLTAAAAVAGAAWLAWRRRDALGGLPGWLGRSIGAALVAGACVAAWPAYQVAMLGHLSPVHSEVYIARYEAARADFDYLRYFTSFHGIDLLRRPNRNLNALDEDHDSAHNRYGNSFWTLLYSETWGDHWLHVSGPVKVEGRVATKRLSLAAALPTLPWLGFRMGAGIRGVIVRMRERAEDRDLWLLLAGFLTLGVALYLYWHLDSGLTPGKNSSVKFIYNAYLFPVGLLLCFSTPLHARARKLAVAYALLLFAATLPFSVFIPGL